MIRPSGLPDTTPEELPWGYSIYRSIWDDLSGYEPMIVGSDTDPTGREVILIALSPGQYVSATMILRTSVAGEGGVIHLEEIIGGSLDGVSAGHLGSALQPTPTSSVESYREAL